MVNDYVNEWKRDWNTSMIRRIMQKNDLSPRKKATNFDDYYGETAD